jgi:hypothetical protein
MSLFHPYTQETQIIMSAKHFGRLLVAAILLSTLAALPVLAQKAEEPKPAGVPVIWRDPGDISRRNLGYGPGSVELAPVAPFTFVKSLPQNARARGLESVDGFACQLRHEYSQQPRAGHDKLRDG